MHEIEISQDYNESIEMSVGNSIPLGVNSMTYDCDTIVSDMSFVSRPNTAASSAVPLYMDAFIPMLTMTSFLSSEPSPKATSKSHAKTAPAPSVTLPGWESENYHYITCLAEENSENDVEVEIFKLALELEGEQAVLLKKSPTTVGTRARDELASAIEITRKASVHPNAPKFAVVPKAKRQAPTTTACDFDLKPTQNKGSNLAAIDLVKIRSAHPSEPLTKVVEAVRVPLAKTTSTPLKNKNNLQATPHGMSRMRSIHPHPKKEISRVERDRVPLEKTTSTPTNQKNDLEPVPLGNSRMRSIHPMARKEVSESKIVRVPLEKTTSTKVSQNDNLEEPSPLSKSRTNGDGISTSLSFDFEMKKERNWLFLTRKKPPVHPARREVEEVECMVGNIEIILDEGTSMGMSEDDKSFLTGQSDLFSRSEAGSAKSFRTEQSDVFSRSEAGSAKSFRTEQSDVFSRSEAGSANLPTLIVEERVNEDEEIEPETVPLPPRTPIVEERVDQDEEIEIETILPPQRTLIIEERVDEDEETEPETASLPPPTPVVEEREDLDEIRKRETSATEEYMGNEARKRSDTSRPQFELNLDEYLTSSPSNVSNNGNGTLENGSMATETTEKASNISGLFVPVQRVREDVVYFPIRKSNKKSKKKKKVTMSSGLRKGDGKMEKVTMSSGITKSTGRKMAKPEKSKPKKEVVVRYATINRAKRPINEKPVKVRMW